MAQGLFLLHSELVAASRDFLALWQTATPVPGDVVTEHAAAVALMPNFCGYPAVVYEDAQGQRHCLFNPANLEAVTAWRAIIDTPTTSSEMSRTAFLARFSAAELVEARSLAKEDPVVDLFWMQLVAADVVDLAYQPVIDGVHYLVGKLAGFDAARADAVLGVTP